MCIYLIFLDVKKKINRDFVIKYMGIVYIYVLWFFFIGFDIFNDCFRVGEEYDGICNYMKWGVVC